MTSYHMILHSNGHFYVKPLRSYSNAFQDHWRVTLLTSIVCHSIILQPSSHPDQWRMMMAIGDI
jgi:hypothetical protein